MRARRVLRQLGLEEAGPLERAPSAANEVWFVGALVIRISASRGTRRLAYETDVVRSLPKGVRYPEILAYGHTDFAEYLVTRRAPGEVLSRAWGTMDHDARREAVHQLGHQLRLVHGCRGPKDPSGPIVPPFCEGDTLECPHQLPVPHLLALLGRAARLPHVEPEILEQARELVALVGPALDDWPGNRLIHGDAHFENVLWDGEQVTALLDFEYARLAPADLDLDVLLRFCADPALHVASDYEHLTTRDQYRAVPVWLREAHPKLFAHPRLGERLVLYNLAYDVRNLLLDPPRRPPAQLPPFHPYHRIRRIVEGRTHLLWMEL